MFGGTQVKHKVEGLAGLGSRGMDGHTVESE